MKKVVFYLSDFQSGGTEWFALRLARELKDKGIMPLFLVSQKKGELIKLIRSEFDTTVLNGKGYNLGALLLTLPATLRFLKQHKPDALISGLPLLNIIAAIAIQFTKHPCKLIAVEHMRHNEDGNVFFRMKQKIKQHLTCWVHKRATNVVCVSKTVLNDMVKGVCGDAYKPQLIYNPIVPSNVESLKNEVVSHRWINNKKAPLLLAIGRLLPVKDFETLLRAFKGLLETQDAKLLLLGEGTEIEGLETLIAELKIQNHVSMPGTVDNVFPYLKAADIFVLSSTNEAFGNVIVEALACGTPVVSTDCGGPREILEDERFGLLVPPSNPAALKEAIIKALKREHDANALIERSKDFSGKAAADAYIKLLNT